MLIGEVRRGSGWLTTIETPVIASFAMVFWDLAMDPTRATIQKLWIWEDSGGFFGVPLVNFLGWSLLDDVGLLLARLERPSAARFATWHDGTRTPDRSVFSPNCVVAAKRLTYRL
jgi:uncharacterized membrane protein